jgi:4'-phosphopantetheinyl transferase EntD
MGFDLPSMRYNLPETSEPPPLEPTVVTSMLGSRFVVSVARPRLLDNRLFPEERRHIARAVDKRRAEFATARVHARHALSQLGVEPCPLVPNPDRSPRWPPGIKGSISHTAGCCVVAVTRASEVAGLGLDVEEDTPLPAELVRMVCTPEERLWVDGFGSAEKGWLTKLTFSAKEAFYKCQYGLTQTQLDFGEVQLRMDLPAQAFSVTSIKRDGSQWARIRRASGKFRRVSGFILTTSTLLTAMADGSP